MVEANPNKINPATGVLYDRSDDIYFCKEEGVTDIEIVFSTDPLDTWLASIDCVSLYCMEGIDPLVFVDGGFDCPTGWDLILDTNDIIYCCPAGYEYCTNMASPTYGLCYDPNYSACG